MKKVILILSMLLSYSAYAQRTIEPTDELIITGKVEEEIIFNLKDISNFKIVNIPDIIIRNHKGEVKDTTKGLQGFLLKDLLDKIEYPIEKPRELNEFYFTFIASDEYKAVFSWNEIYNTDIGNSLYLVTRIGDKDAQQMDQSILIASTKDFHIGPRYVKAVKKIVVSRVR